MQAHQRQRDRQSLPIRARDIASLKCKEARNAKRGLPPRRRSPPRAGDEPDGDVGGQQDQVDHGPAGGVQPGKRSSDGGKLGTANPFSCAPRRLLPGPDRTAPPPLHTLGGLRPKPLIQGKSLVGQFLRKETFGQPLGGGAHLVEGISKLGFQVAVPSDGAHGLLLLARLFRTATR
jgi:hypothetical protein